MRHTIPFDTYAYVKQLTAAGVPESQAEVHARALAALVDEELATKRDIEELRIATKRDIDELRIASQRDLTETELRLKAHLEGELRKQMLWFFAVQTGLLAAAVAVIVAIVKLV